ncbi:MAG: nitrous oxide-stimulated promoter family protein [Anaerolineae bacterium]
MRREEKTIAAMVALYCHDHHGTKADLCAECDTLLAYARERLKHCPYQERKSTCAKCPIHCYKPEMREKVRDVMRYAGPRMLLRYPLLAVSHLVDGLRKAPSAPK